MATQEQALTRTAGAVATRHGFEGTEVTPVTERAAVAVAAREKAAVEARFLMAMKNPRNVEQFRVDLLQDCRRPGFAQVARYAKPVGGVKIEGPSIRFVEAALRHYRNVMPEVTTVYDDDTLRICRVVVADFESNIGYATEVNIVKTVERKNSKGRRVLGERPNTYDETVYIVEATEDEVNTKQAALISKAIRTQGLRLLPGDIVEEAQAACMQTLVDGANKDRVGTIRRLIDGFTAMGIQPTDLEMFFGKPLDKCSGKELEELRLVGQSIKDGETTWAEIMEAKDPSGTQDAADDVAKAKLQKMQDMQRSGAAPQPAAEMQPEADRSDAAELTEEEMRADQARQDAEAEVHPKQKPMFSGRRRQ